MKASKKTISLNINKEIIKYGVYYLIAITILCFFNFNWDNPLSDLALFFSPSSAVTEFEMSDYR